MQARAYEGYFESGNFYTSGKLFRIPERRKVYLTVIDEPVQENTDTAKWLDELERMVIESPSAKLNMADFPRMDFGREPVIL